MSEDFIEFNTIAELEGILTHLGPVDGGDVLLFRNFEFDDTTRQQVMDAVMNHYLDKARATMTGEIHSSAVVPLLVFLQGGQAVEHLDAELMRRHGWVRA